MPELNAVMSPLEAFYPIREVTSCEDMNDKLRKTDNLFIG